jgi:tripartite-type tricarboxylate transporter receptor subunit TctC
MKMLIALCAAWLMTVSGAALAQAGPPSAYPQRPIKFIVPYPPGGGYDFMARNIGQRLSESLGQPVVIENRAGANGNIGSDLVAKSAPDGYTLLLGGIGPQALSVALYPRLPYNAEKDFQPIALVASQPNLLIVHPSLPVKNVAELVAYAKANPGKLSFGSAGSGSGQHFGLGLFRQVAGVDVVHVPYKAAPQLHLALLSGEVPAGFNIVQLPMQHVRKGELRALAVASKRRSVLAEDVPTMAELGMPMDFDTWYAVYAPAGTPREIVARLNNEINRILATPELKQRANALGIELQGGSPEQLAAHQKAEITRWSSIARSADIKVD